MTITIAIRAGAGIAMGSDLNVGHLAREENAESRAQGRAKGMAAFLKFVDEAVDLSAEKPPEVPIKAKSEPVKVVSPAIPGRNDAMFAKGLATRREKPSDGFAYPPRGMDANQAAAYVGLGHTKFLEMVKVGHMPKPVDLDGSTRWDRVDLDHKMDDLKETRQNPSTASRTRINARLDEQERETEHETRIALRPKR
jgi:predicted DNA-binding transcriptional regulator AlpA